MANYSCKSLPYDLPFSHNKLHNTLQCTIREHHLPYEITQVNGNDTALYGKPISELWSITCHRLKVDHVCKEGVS